MTVTPEQFDLLCIDNPDLRLELTPNRELIVTTPAGGKSSEKNHNLSGQLFVWNEKNELGRAFDSSGGYDFTALGGGKPSPDVSWVEKSRLEGVNIVGFISVVPDFVIKLWSATEYKSLFSETAHCSVDYRFLKALLFKGLKQVTIPNYMNRCSTRHSTTPLDRVSRTFDRADSAGGRTA